MVDNVSALSRLQEYFHQNRDSQEDPEHISVDELRAAKAELGSELAPTIDAVIETYGELRVLYKEGKWLHDKQVSMEDLKRAIEPGQDRKTERAAFLESLDNAIRLGPVLNQYRWFVGQKVGHDEAETLAGLVSAKVPRQDILDIFSLFRKEKHNPEQAARLTATAVRNGLRAG